MIPSREEVFWVGFLALIILGAYFPVFFSEYGYTDDYIAVLFNKTVGPWNLKTLPTALGRPIYSIFTGYAFGPIESIGGLSYLRAFSVGWLILSASASFLILRNLKITSPTAALTAAALTLNPAAGVFAGWAITSIYPVSIFLSLMGGWLLIRTMEERKLPKALSGMLCILLSFFIYQPTALACVVLFGVYYYSTEKKQNSSTILNWITVLGLASFTMVIYYGLYKAYLPLIESYGLTNERGGIVTDIPTKLVYFLKGPLWESTIWWGYYAPKWFGWSIVVGLIFCVLSLLRRHILESGWLKSLSLTVLLLATLLLAASPILVPHQNGLPIRVFYSLMSLLGAIPAIALAHLPGKQFRRLSFLFAIMIMGGLSHFFVTNGIIKPNSKEVATYKTYLQKNVPSVPSIAFFKPPFLGAKYFTNLKKFHEYGGYSSWLPWVPHPLINILFWEQFPELTHTHTEIEIIQIYPWQIHQYPEDVLILDATYIFKGRYSPPYTAYKRNMLKALVRDEYVDPLYGTTETLNRSWFYSESFGFLRKRGSNLVDFLDYGTYTVEQTESAEGNVVMIQNDGTRLITSAEEFPKVYSAEDSRWYTLPLSRVSL